MAGNRISPGQRARRVGDQIQRELADILRTLRDPRLADITVMAVEVSRDLSLARIYVAHPSVEAVDRTTIETVLNKAVGRIRTDLGRRLSIYAVPKLVFVYDLSVERGIHLTQLIAEAAASRAKDDDDEPVDG